MLLINLHHSWHYLSLKNWNPGYKLEPWLAGKIFTGNIQKQWFVAHAVTRGVAVVSLLT